jgi:hypothetical protein
MEARARELASGLFNEMERCNSALYEEESQKIELFFQDIQEQKRMEIHDLESALADLKRERAKLPLTAAQQINTEIQRTKDKIIELEEQIAESRRMARDRERELLDNLDQRAQCHLEVTRLLDLTFLVK